MKRYLKGFAPLLIAGSLLAGCGGSDSEGAADKAPPSTVPDTGVDDLVTKAKAEGKVMIYSNQASVILDDLVAAFEATYPGVDAEYFRGVDPDLQAKVEADDTSGKPVADVYIGADLVWSRTKAADGWFAEPTGPNFVGEGDVDVAAAVQENNDFEIGAAVITFAWNESVTDAITSYEDLLDPSLAGGKIGVVEPTTAAPSDFYLWLEEQFGAEYVEKLGAQKPRIYPGAAPLMEALGSGEIAATPYAPVSLAVSAAERGAAVKYGQSEGGSWGTRYWAGVLAKAPNPSAAQLFANFLMGPEGQRISSKDSSSFLPGIDGTFTSNDNVEFREPLTPDEVTTRLADWEALFRG